MLQSSASARSSRRAFLRATGLFTAATCLGGSILALTGCGKKQAAPGGGSAPGEPLPLAHGVRHFPALGTTVEIQALHEDPALLDRALTRAQALVAGLEQKLSIYLPNSELNRLNTHGRLDAPSPEFVALLRRAEYYAQLTGGAFDVSVQPLWDCYGGVPGAPDAASALALVGHAGIRVTDTRVTLARPGMKLTLNGIAQGFITDAVHAELGRLGIEHALVDCGEWRALGTKDRAGDKWTLGLAHPRQTGALLGTLPLDTRAVATSGDNRTRLPGGRHHLFDPHTGASPTGFQMLTVLAADATEADALSTALFVMPPRQADAFLSERPAIGCVAVLGDGRVIKAGNVHNLG